MRTPDFYIVGAPKCGTTALYHYLRRHPQIFMPEHKEPHFFGSDLDFRDQHVPTREEYLRLFEPARPDQRCGEASVFYLYSRRAAEEIHRFDPDARIIVMLRHPVDVMYSFHSQRVFNGTEDLPFSAALAAESERREGRGLPARIGLLQGLFYRELVAFATQLERYLETFGRERVHVIVYDDFRADPVAVFRQVCLFLGVRTDVDVAGPLVVNANKTARVGWIRDVLWRPPEPLRTVVRLALPVRALRSSVARTARRLNSRQAPREPLAAGLRHRLTKELEVEIKQIGELIGRDLTSWSET